MKEKTYETRRPRYEDSVRTHWCRTHQRIATKIRIGVDGGITHVCDPKLGGITMVCDTVDISPGYAEYMNEERRSR